MTSLLGLVTGAGAHFTFQTTTNYTWQFATELKLSASAGSDTAFQSAVQLLFHSRTLGQQGLPLFCFGSGPKLWACEDLQCLVTKIRVKNYLQSPLDTEHWNVLSCTWGPGN